MAALALAGITGMYLRQDRKAGLLGLVGYLVFAAGYLAHVRRRGHRRRRPPDLVDTAARASSTTSSPPPPAARPDGDIGGLQTLFNVTGAGYMLGGLLFGIALFRAGVLARWAAALLAVSTVGTAALAVLPESFNRPFAVPEGIALIGLGVSLWRDQRHAAATSADTAPRRAQPQSDDHASRSRPMSTGTGARSWPVPVALVALSAIPLDRRAPCGWSSSPAAPESCRPTTGSPASRSPLVVHIVGAAVFALVGMFQFVPALPPPAPGLAPPRRPGRWPWPGCWWRSRRCG